MTNGSVQQQKQAAETWMNKQAGTRMLQRLLVLVPGVCDELSGCWVKGSKPFTNWGSKVFTNWAAETVVFKFPPASDDPLPGGPLAGRRLENFLDMGDYLRVGLNQILSTRGLGDGEYDLMGHSMGSLDAFAALVEIDPVGHPIPPDQVLPVCHTLIAVDSPWFGVENMDVRERFPSFDTQRSQCRALDRGSPLLQNLQEHIGGLTPRVRRVLAYAADTVFYPEVGVASADIYRDRRWRETARSLRYNDCLSIEGAAHSGEGGITNSPIFIKDVFLRLSEVDAPMRAIAPRPAFAPMSVSTAPVRGKKKAAAKKGRTRKSAAAARRQKTSVRKGRRKVVKNSPTKALKKSVGRPPKKKKTRPPQRRKISL